MAVRPLFLTACVDYGNVALRPGHVEPCGSGSGRVRRTLIPCGSGAFTEQFTIELQKWLGRRIVVRAAEWVFDLASQMLYPTGSTEPMFLRPILACSSSAATTSATGPQDPSVLLAASLLPSGSGYLGSSPLFAVLPSPPQNLFSRGVIRARLDFLMARGLRERVALKSRV